MKDKLLIIGASGHGKVVADVALKMKKWNIISFFDDNESIKNPMGIEVIGKLEDVLKYKDEFDIFVAIGDNLTRKKIQSKLENEGVSFPTLIHPSAIIGKEVEMGCGTVIMAGTVINCCTRIGKGCIINTGATIDHDNIIDNYVHVSPGVHIAGTVEIGDKTWLGIGSVVSNNVKITHNCKIGAGAVVINNIIEPATYIGIPARRAY